MKCEAELVQRSLDLLMQYFVDTAMFNISSKDPIRQLINSFYQACLLANLNQCFFTFDLISIYKCTSAEFSRTHVVLGF